MSRTRMLVAAALVLGAGAARGQRPSGAGTTDRVPPQAVIVAPGSDSALEARTSQIASQLRCPVCQGESIQDSPSELAAQMRGLVKDQLREGRSAEQIKAYFVSKYGEWILLAPRATGFNVLVYAAPVLMILAGLAVIGVAVRKWTSPGTAQGR